MRLRPGRVPPARQAPRTGPVAATGIRTTGTGAPARVAPHPYDRTGRPAPVASRLPLGTGTVPGLPVYARTGATLHPLSGYLLLRGPAPLPLRMGAASASAAEPADRLAARPGLARVHCPGRASGRPVGQMAGGGAILSL
jgi:hypothetical protein